MKWSMKVVCCLAVLVSTLPVRGREVEMPETLRVASVQIPIFNTPEENLGRILQGVSEAAEQGARIVLFPETALSGFVPEAINALDWEALKKAEGAIANAAESHNIYVLYGSVTDSGKERPFNSAVLVGPDGVEITRYHKMVPERHFEPGDHLELFEVDGVPCTMIICHDERYPELVRIPVLGGARVLFYISYEINSVKSALYKQEGYRAQLMARAMENGIWAVQSNGIGSPPGSDGGSMSLGHSRIIEPGGGVIAEAPGLTETMLVEDIRPAAANRGNAKRSMDIALLSDWWKSGMELLRVHPPTTQTVSTVPAKDTVRLGLMKGGLPVKWGLEENFKIFLDLVKVAEQEEVDLFITPECWLDGYAAPDKGSTPERLRAVAQDLETSPYLKRVAEEAKNRGLWICFGFTSLEDGEIYNTVGLWNDQGERVALYHKSHLQTHDLQYSPGEELPVWDTPWGPLGMMICADRRWPETVRTLRLKGARLILNPTYGMHGETNEHMMRTRGFENQCFIAFSHPQLGLVIDPKGHIEAKLESEQPEVLVTEVDLARAKDDNHLRDRRPELYQILTAPKR